MNNQTTWNVTDKYLQLEKNLVSDVAKLFSLLAERKLNLPEEDPIVRQMDKINTTLEKSCHEFNNCYRLTSKTNLILTNIPIMN
ncbi:hypothetical protein C0389_04770 [bacterium]|nr:hypothetical protein [bacterium]